MCDLLISDIKRLENKVHIVMSGLEENPGCVFCQIVAGKLESKIVRDFEAEGILVFKDIRPASDVHLLAIPKKHIDW